MENFLNRLLDNLRKGPLGPVVRWMGEHPRLSMWIVLATGMVILLYREAKDVVGIQPGNWVTIVVATVIVAGLCVWIVTWEDEEEGILDKATSGQPSQAQVAPSGIKTGKATTGKAKPAARKGTGKLSRKGAKEK